ncbi:MAG: RNA polymerase sigma-70 factor [Ferruginibacter sp.]
MDEPEPYHQDELLLEIAKGNEKAFRRLFDHYWNRIYSVSLVVTKNPHLAEEIVQDVFLKIWVKREQLSEVKRFEGYLITIAKNHIYNELRRKTLEQPFINGLEEHFLETTELPGQLLELKEATQLIAKVVAELPQQQRLVYEMSRNEQLDYQTIAERLGITRSTVKNHMTKALQAIRTYLDKHKGELLFAFFLMRKF